jgi:cytosine/adenosine deaminase-related metal-dependent hydrolase
VTTKAQMYEANVILNNVQERHKAEVGRVLFGSGWLISVGDLLMRVHPSKVVLVDDKPASVVWQGKEYVPERVVIPEMVSPGLFMADAHTYQAAMEMLQEHRKAGHWLPRYCRKQVEGCLCAVGFPPEQQCADCREDRIRDSRCECPPKETT